MKKLFALTVTAIVAMAITACGGSSTTEITKSETPVETQASEAESKEGEQSEAETKSELNFESFVAIDNDECKVTIKSVDPNSFWGYAVKVELENKSSDKTYMFSANNAAVNGVMCTPLFAKEVAPGKKANDSIDFALSELKDNGLEDETDIEIFFRVYDSNDWLSGGVAEQSVHVYPYGEDKATTFVRESKSTDNVIVDNDYVTVIQTGITEDNIWGYTVNLYLVNKSDKNIMYTVEDASVNGYMADPFFAKEVLAGKTAFASVSWSDQTLADNDIENVENIEFTLRAYDNDTWTDEYAKEPVTITP